MRMGDGMAGYRKLKNNAGYTNAQLLAKMTTVEYSFGTPGIGKIGKREGIIFDTIDGFTVYVLAKMKFIEIGRSLTRGATGLFLGRFVSAFFTEKQLRNVKEADRAVEEIYDVLSELLENKVEENSNEEKAGTILYMRQSILTQSDCYEICTEEQHPVYWIESDSSGAEFQIRNEQGESLLTIRKRNVFVLPQYIISKNEVEIGRIYRRSRLAGAGIAGAIREKELKITGDLQTYRFTMFLNDTAAIEVEPVQLSWGEVYAIKIAEGMDTLLTVAALVGIDNMIDRMDD